MKAFHRLSLGMVVAVLTIGVVIVRHVSDVGKFDDLDHNRLLKDSELLVNFYVQEGRDYWKASELPIECSYVRGISPLQVVTISHVVGLEDIGGYEVDIRMRSGFRHLGLVVVVGASKALDNYVPVRGYRHGWRNERLGNRIFWYQE
jgi:hypothetical protein